MTTAKTQNKPAERCSGVQKRLAWPPGSPHGGGSTSASEKSSRVGHRVVSDLSDVQDKLHHECWMVPIPLGALLSARKKDFNQTDSVCRCHMLSDSYGANDFQHFQTSPSSPAAYEHVTGPPTGTSRFLPASATTCPQVSWTEPATPKNQEKTNAQMETTTTITDRISPEKGSQGCWQRHCPAR